MGDSDSSEESDWEEVKEEDYILPKQEEDEEDEEITAKEYTAQLDIPKEGIQITLEDENQGRRKKGFDLAAYIRRQVNQRKRELQEDIHKVHVLCLFSRGLYINRILKAEDVLGVGMSVLPSKQSYPPKNVDLTYLESFMKWFRKTYKVIEDTTKDISALGDIKSSLVSMIESKKVVSTDFLVFIFIVILRALGVHVRLLISLQPLPLKPSSADLMQNPERKSGGKKKKSSNNYSINDEEDSMDADSPSGSLNIKKESPGSSQQAKGNSKKKTESAKSTKSSKNQPSTSRAKSESKSAKSTKKESPSTSARAQSESKSAKSSKKQPSTSARAQSEGVKETPRRASLRKAKSVASSKETVDEDFEVETLSSEPSDFSDSDQEDFDMNRSKSRKRRKQSTVKETPKSKKTKKEVGKGRKIVSSDEDDGTPDSKTGKTPVKSKAKRFVDVWAEVYLEEEERWVSVDLLNEKIMCDGDFEAKATPPLIYVIAYGHDERVKDVTRRYASKWLTGTQKLRVDTKWWNATLKPFVGKRTKRDREEDKWLDQQLMNQPIPTSVQEVKNHPLYAMRRHLLKFEAIYPPDPPPLGFIKNEPVYSRNVVFTLHSRELWIKQAKVVRVGEKPYKIVTARPKWDRATSTVIKDRPLELFGEWQVEDYIPPPAVDGKVPRNEYGNVELFKPSMLPKGTVHLREPGLNRTAKKLGIDCAPALVGFEFHSGGSHPTYDGFVVCEEFKDVLLDAWREDQIQAEKREEERRRKRARENWRRLIRMVIVRRRLERKYESFNFGGDRASGASSSSSSGKTPRKRPPSSASSYASGEASGGRRKRTASGGGGTAGSNNRVPVAAAVSSPSKKQRTTRRGAGRKKE